MLAMNLKKQKPVEKPLSLFRTIKVPKLNMPRPKRARELDIKDGRNNRNYWLQ